MLKSLLQTVTLPDGEQVTVSTAPEAWWTQQNASGYVNPAHIAPDPKNPRRRMGGARLAELNESIKARGVRQQLIVTPRSLAPWAQVAPEHANRFFIAVSGHRRHNGATLAGIGAVPIKVVIYKSEKDHRMDMSLLNKGQDDLTPLEEGYEIVELQRLEWTTNELASAFGLAKPQMYARMYLTRLHPDIQAMLDSELPRKQRLLPTLGGVIGGLKTPTPDELEEKFLEFKDVVRRSEIMSVRKFDDMSADDLRFTLQKLYLEVIRRRSMSANQATDLIRDGTLRFRSAQGAGGRPTQRYQPKRRKEIINSLLNEVNGSMAVQWPPQELRRIFELSPREEIDSFAKRIRMVARIFTGLATTLEQLRDEKKPLHPDVAKYMTKKALV